MKHIIFSIAFILFAFNMQAQQHQWDSAFVKYVSTSVKTEDGAYKHSAKKKMPVNSIDMIGMKIDSSRMFLKVKMDGDVAWVTREFEFEKRVVEDHSYKLYYTNEKGEVVIFIPRLRRYSYWDGVVYDNGEKKFLHLYY